MPEMAGTYSEPIQHRIRAIPCDVYSRIVGYYRPVDSWNRGKREEFKDRKMITIPKGGCFDKED
jgi:hypothetical protein